MKKLIYLSFILLLVGAFSCTTETTEKDNQNADSTKVDTQNQEAKQYFNLPSPIELYADLNNASVPFKLDALNKTDKLNEYVSISEKALNLGVYASDIAYCAVNGMSNETMNSFVAAKKIADELGLAEGFDDKITSRINNNLDKPDSLNEISTDSYSMAINYLRSQNQEDILPLLIFGGWIESVYITADSYNATKFSEEDILVNKIFEQGFLLENLVDYFNSLNNTTKDFETINEQISELQGLYDETQDNKEALITESQFKAITAKVIEIRNFWTKNQ